MFFCGIPGAASLHQRRLPRDERREFDDHWFRTSLPSLASRPRFAECKQKLNSEADHDSLSANRGRAVDLVPFTAISAS